MLGSTERSKIQRFFGEEIDSLKCLYEFDGWLVENDKLTWVNEIVFLKMSILSKWFRTNFTEKRSFIGVSSQVNFEVRQLTESFPTLKTFINDFAVFLSQRIRKRFVATWRSFLFVRRFSWFVIRKNSVDGKVERKISIRIDFRRWSSRKMFFLLKIFPIEKMFERRIRTIGRHPQNVFVDRPRRNVRLREKSRARGKVPSIFSDGHHDRSICWVREKSKWFRSRENVQLFNVERRRENEFFFSSDQWAKSPTFAFDQSNARTAPIFDEKTKRLTLFNLSIFELVWVSIET